MTSEVIDAIPCWLHDGDTPAALGCRDHVRS
jgi:hypothetical protein